MVAVVCGVFLESKRCALSVTIHSESSPGLGSPATHSTPRYPLSVKVPLLASITHFLDN